MSRLKRRAGKMQKKTRRAFFLRNAMLADVSAIHKLIRADQKHLLPRSRKEIAENINGFAMATDGGGKIIGCASLENYSPRIAEIRSLTVVAKHRRNGIGGALVKELSKRAGKKQQLFVVTSNVRFFQKVGFDKCLNEKYILFLQPKS